MIDEDDDPGADESLPFARSYDYFKHTTGVSLISLGGVFAFADSKGAAFEAKQLVIVLTFIGLPGVISLMMVSVLAALEVKPEPQAKVARWIRYSQFAVSFLLAVGLGSFIFNFTGAILK